MAIHYRVMFPTVFATVDWGVPRPVAWSFLQTQRSYKFLSSGRVEVVPFSHKDYNHKNLILQKMCPIIIFCWIVWPFLFFSGWFSSWIGTRTTSDKYFWTRYQSVRELARLLVHLKTHLVVHHHLDLLSQMSTTVERKEQVERMYD